MFFLLHLLHHLSHRTAATHTKEGLDDGDIFDAPDAGIYAAIGVLLCRAVLCRAALCCAALCCVLLCCVVLCCAVLCCAVLCCVGLFSYWLSSLRAPRLPAVLTGLPSKQTPASVTFALLLLLILMSTDDEEAQTGETVAPAPEVTLRNGI